MRQHGRTLQRKWLAYSTTEPDFHVRAGLTPVCDAGSLQIGGEYEERGQIDPQNFIGEKSRVGATKRQECCPRSTLFGEFNVLGRARNEAIQLQEIDGAHRNTWL